MTAPPEPLNRLSAVELAARIRSGDTSARAVVESCLSAIASEDAALHAFITVCAADALAEADRLDTIAATGHFLGPLHGVPFAVKDLIATAGVRTTFGSLQHADNVPATDDLIVARLKHAGAILIGKTNTPEFGFGALCDNLIAGNTANPYARDRTSGGSSGGSAVALATGMVPLALGTDFGGSVRTPASFCNVVGFRPGPGLVPKVPKRLLWETMSVSGLLARNAGDVALMLSAIVGGDHRDPAVIDYRTLPPPQALATPRVAISRDLGIASIASAVSAVFETSAARLNTVAEVARDAPDFSGAQEAFECLRGAMLFAEFRSQLDNPAVVLSDQVRRNAERGRTLSGADVYDAEARRAQIYQNCVAFFHRYDFLVTPAASVPPFPLDQPEIESIDGIATRNLFDYLTITYAISLVGLPVLSLPCGFTPDGLPIGMQIVAGPRREPELLAFAARLEHELGFVHSFPA